MLSIHNLTAGYGKLAVLHQLHVDIQMERFTTILGPNGSGKSTLLKSIFGLTTISSGSIQIESQELVGIPTERIGDFGIAYVPQRENVFASMTVMENLQLAGRKLSKADAQTRFDQAHELFPILARRRNQAVSQMSGGERQMVAIAMGWLNNPQLMLLDEPTAGLAPLVAKEVFATLQNLSRTGISMVVVEQNARSAMQWCDDVIILREGELAFTGSGQECREDQEILKKYLGITLKTSQ